MELKKWIKEAYHWWADDAEYGRRQTEINRTGIPKKLINFQIGDASRGGLRAPDIINDELIHAAHGRWNEYAAYARTKHGEAAKGPLVPRMKEAIIHREKSVHNVTYDPGNIWIGAGSMTGINRVELNLMGPGDEWLALEPIYEHYLWHRNLRRYNWVSWKQIEDLDWTPDREELRSKITENSTGILMVSPCNPTGAVYSEKTLKEICDIAGEHELVIMVDEVQDVLVHDGDHTATSIAEVAGDVPVFKVDSFSKSMHLPGWSIGWLLLHDPDGKLDNIKPGISKVGEIVGGGAATPIIAAAASVLEKITDFTAHLTESYKTLKRRANVTMKSIEEVEGLSLVKPKGGLWGYTKIDYGTTWKDDYAFAHQLLEEEAISIIPGPCWGPTYGPGHFRTTLLEPVELIEEAYRRIDSFLRRHC